MKRFLSIALTVGFTVSAFSQNLWSDNFNSYNTGNLGTQGGWARYESTGAAAITQVQTIDAENGKSFKVVSPASNQGIWHFHDTKWSTKSSANNIFYVEFDYYTGAGGADGAGVVQIYDIDADEALTMEIGWSQDEGYIYIADEVDGIILEETANVNTWYRIKASYNTTTGEIKAQVNNGEIFEYQGSPAMAPTEFDVLAAGVSSVAIDNISVKAVNADPFLAVSDASVKSVVSVYPNPATDVINIKSAKKIVDVTLFDLSGKVAKKSSETTFNIENLAKGSYVVKINYADGSTESKKVIKK